MAKVAQAPTTCPKCQGTEFWDNRGNKKSPKHPDWKCKNTNCGEGFWLDTPQGQTPQVAQGGARPARPPQTWENMTRVYQRCARIASATWGKADAQATVAAAATLFIQANQAGLQVEGAHKPAPAPVPAPVAVAAGPGLESFADFPEALDGGDDGLPW